MRTLFLALLLGEERGERLAAGVAGALGAGAGRRFRLPRPDGLHLTLFYLGRTAPETAERVSAAVAPAVRGCGVPRLVVDAAGAFPRRGGERVLWLGVREDPATAGRLATLHGAVLDALERAGVDTATERERPFRPHVSVARPRPGARTPEAFYGLAPALAWAPDALHLVESVAADGPRRYVSRTAFALGA